MFCLAKMSMAGEGSRDTWRVLQGLDLGTEKCSDGSHCDPPLSSELSSKKKVRWRIIPAAVTCAAAVGKEKKVLVRKIESYTENV